MLSKLAQAYATHGADKTYRVFTIETNGVPQDELLAQGQPSVFNGKALYKAAPMCRPGGVLKVFFRKNEDVKTSVPTEYTYTCIGASSQFGHPNPYSYAVCHKDGEYVDVTNVDNLGELDLDIDFGRFIHVKRIGIVTLKAIGNAGAQSFNVKDGSGTTPINWADIGAAGQLSFENDDVAGTFSEIKCNYIGQKLSIVHHDDPVEANNGKAIVYVVYDYETAIEFSMPLKPANDVYSQILLPYQVHGKIKPVSKTAYKSGALNNNNRFVVAYGATPAAATAATTAAQIDGNWNPVGNDDAVFKGQYIYLKQTVADGNNVQIALKGKLEFENA